MFTNRRQKKAERSVLFSRLKSHKKSICSLSERYDEQADILKNNVGKLSSKLILIRLRNVLRYSNTQQLPTKNKLLFQLKKFKTPKFDVPLTSATVTVLNVSGLYLNLKGLKYSLHHCFIDKSRLVRRNIATELEYLVHTVQRDISSQNLENFHGYVRKMTNKFTQNIRHVTQRIILTIIYVISKVIKILFCCQETRTPL